MEDDTVRRRSSQCLSGFLWTCFVKSAKWEGLSSPTRGTSAILQRIFHPRAGLCVWLCGLWHHAASGKSRLTLVSIVTNRKEERWKRLSRWSMDILSSDEFQCVKTRIMEPPQSCSETQAQFQVKLSSFQNKSSHTKEGGLDYSNLFQAQNKLPKNKPTKIKTELGKPF